MTREEKLVRACEMLREGGFVPPKALIYQIVDAISPESDHGMLNSKLVQDVFDLIEASPDFTNYDISQMIVDKLLLPAEPTVKEYLDRCVEIIGHRRQRSWANAAEQEEFDIAIRRIESAQMRYARGRHMQEGSFSPSDVDRWLADGKDVKTIVAERDRAAGKTT